MGSRSPSRLVAALVLSSSIACTFDASGVGTSAGVSIGDAGTGTTVEVTSSADSGDTSPTMPTSADSTGEPPMSCSGGGTCGTTAPAQWAGPFAINTASPPNDGQQCPPGWELNFVAGLDLTAQPATCACDCVAAPADCTVGVSYYSDQGCTVAVEAGGSDGSCDGALGTSSDHGFVRAVGMPEGGSCTPMEHYAVPEVEWATGSVLCAPPLGDGCPDGPCMPAVPPGFEDAWCIVGEGDQACPAGPYTARTVMSSGIEDTRNCTPCGCSMQGTIACAGQLVEYYDSFCAVQAGSVAIDGECHAADIGGTDAWSVRYDGDGALYSCVNNEPAAVGEATARDPITICCTG